MSFPEWACSPRGQQTSSVKGHLAYLLGTISPVLSLQHILHFVPLTTLKN